MHTCLGAIVLVALLGIPAVARAQGAASVQLGDPDPPTWDVFGHMAWLTVNKSDIAPEWNRWYDAAAVGGSLGRFFGRHVKVEGDIATAAAAEVYVERELVVPGQRYPLYISQPARFRMTTVSGGVSYQFLDNRWFHPVAGIGIEAAREVRTVDRVLYPIPVPPGAPVEEEGTTATWRSLPFAAVGFKWFVTERAFIRSDVRTTFDGSGLSHVSWRSGFGFDF